MCGFYHDDFRCVTGYGQWRAVCLRALRGDVWDVPHPCAAGGREFGAASDDEFGPGGLGSGLGSRLGPGFRGSDRCDDRCDRRQI